MAASKHATGSTYGIGRVGGDLDKIAVGVLAMERGHWAEGTDVRYRANSYRNIRGLEPRDDRLQTSSPLHVSQFGSAV
jgi:hypothetical protein